MIFRAPVLWIMRERRATNGRANLMNRVRLLPAALCLSAVCGLLAACQTVTEHVIPHSRHAGKSVLEVVSEVFDRLARTQRDIENAFGAAGSGDRGRIFVHVRGTSIGPGLVLSAIRDVRDSVPAKAHARDSA